MRDTKKLGYNMGCKNGWFVWPVPAANGKYVEIHQADNLVVKRPSMESHKICKEFCKINNDNLSTEIKSFILKTNTGIKDSNSCSKFCDNVLKYVKEKETPILEGYDNKHKNPKWGMIILLSIIVFLLVLVIMGKKYRNSIKIV